VLSCLDARFETFACLDAACFDATDTSLAWLLRPGRFDAHLVHASRSTMLIPSMLIRLDILNAELLRRSPLVSMLLAQSCCSPNDSSIRSWLASIIGFLVARILHPSRILIALLLARYSLRCSS
jgi:hypothetical protein